MAATSSAFPGISLPFKPQIPITPPPDCLNFAIKSPKLSTKSTPPSKEPATAMDPHAEPQLKTPSTSATSPKPITASTPCICTNLDGSSSTTTTNTTTVPSATQMDPRHVALVSRIAAYYQQRSQAVANYQHQKCQAWANMQRAKYQEMTQAAMLVVAWYVRDRIQRRRKREKRQFRRGLSERSTSTAATSAGVGKRKRVETTVDKWIGHVPKEVLLSPNTAALDMPIDKEELRFSMDAEPIPVDGDDKLFAVADGMIKSQLARIDVPLMGALDFTADDDDSDSGSDFEDVRRWTSGDGDDKDLGSAGQGEEDDEDDEYSYEDDNDDDMEDLAGEDVSSKLP